MAFVVLQAGHCFRRSGATGTNGVDGDPNEQEFAYGAASLAADMIRRAGHEARVIDADEPDSYYRGDAFVAIHCDGSTNPSARGASVGYRTTEGSMLAAAWKRHYSAEGWAGFRPDNYTTALAGYYGVREAVEQGNRWAFIAEAGFLTSPDDEALLSFPQGPDRFARAVTGAVTEHFGGTSPDDPPIQEDPMPSPWPVVRPLIQTSGADGVPAGTVFLTDGRLLTLRWVPADELAGVSWWLRSAGLPDGIETVDTVRVFGELIGRQPPGWPFTD